MKIIVTGAAGFIGQHVWRKLDERGDELIGVDIMDPQVHGEGAAPNDPRILKATVTDVAAERPDLFQNVDAVIHLAAVVGVGQSQYRPSHYTVNNVVETANLWERMLDFTPAKVVVASSMSVYGEGQMSHYPTGFKYERAATPENWDGMDVVWNDGRRTDPSGSVFPVRTSEWKEPEPTSVYAQSKLDTERYSIILGKEHKIPTVALRFFNTYGEGQSMSNPYTGAVAIFACRVLNGRPPLLYEDGNQSRDFIHVSDIADGIIAAVDAPGLSGVYNLCTGQRTSLIHLARLWCDIAKNRGFSNVSPEILFKLRSGDVRHCWGDPQRFHAVTGWKAQVDLYTGLTGLADWIIENDFHKNLPEDLLAGAMQELRDRGLEE